MPGVGPALSHNLHLGSSRTVEVGGLVRGVGFEFLDAVSRSREHTSRASGHTGALICDTPGGVSGKRCGVHAHTAIHVVGVVAAIQREVALVNCGARHAAVRTDARLHREEGAHVAAESWQSLQLHTRDRIADRGVHGLQFVAGCGYLDDDIAASDLQSEVCGDGDADLYRGPGLAGGKTFLSHAEIISAGSDVNEDVAPRLVCGDGTRGLRGSVCEGYGRAVYK